MNKYIIKETKVSSDNPADLATLALDIIAYLMLEMVRQRRSKYDY
jgi:hypothetical protein